VIVVAAGHSDWVLPSIAFTIGPLLLWLDRLVHIPRYRARRRGAHHWARGPRCRHVRLLAGGHHRHRGRCACSWPPLPRAFATSPAFGLPAFAGSRQSSIRIPRVRSSRLFSHRTRSFPLFNPAINRGIGYSASSGDDHTVINFCCSRVTHD
jgi:hypothetical protein